MCSYFLILLQFYPFGHSENDSTLPPSNDVDSEGMNLTTNLTYYDEQISRVYVRTVSVHKLYSMCYIKEFIMYNTVCI